jgi:hypothetical protein
MHISKRVKVVAGVSALLGVVMAGGAAFTANGVYSTAEATQFIGGSITQSVNGGTTLESVVYSYVDDGAQDTPGNSDTEIDSVLLTFNNDIASTLIPTISWTGTDAGSDASFEYLAADWSCTAIAASTPFTSTCTPTGDLSTSNTPTAGQGYVTDVESITVTVPSS